MSGASTTGPARRVPGITCPEGGHIAGDSDHAGSGLQLRSRHGQGRNILSWRVVALNAPENATLFEQRDEVGAYLRRVGVEVSVLTTDRGFHSTAEKGMPSRKAAAEAL